MIYFLKQGYEINLLLSGDFKNYYGLKDKLKTKSVKNYKDGYYAFNKKMKYSFNDDKATVIKYLKEHKKYSDKPTFFYLHFMSTHQAGIQDTLFNKFKPFDIDISNLNYNSINLSNNYNNKIIQLDNYLKLTFNILKEKGYLKNSIIIITSDHGQSLGENNFVFHSKSVHQSQIEIPLIISNYENNFIQNNLLRNQLDIAPTITYLLNLPKPKNWQGISIFKNIKGRNIFQHQNNFYSIIWKEKIKVYHYIYNKFESSEELFILNDSLNASKNIITQYSIKKRDSIKSLLFSNFKIKH